MLTRGSGGIWWKNLYRDIGMSKAIYGAVEALRTEDFWLPPHLLRDSSLRRSFVEC